MLLAYGLVEAFFTKGVEASALGSTTDVLLKEARPGFCAPETVPESSALPSCDGCSSPFR